MPLPRSHSNHSISFHELILNSFRRVLPYDVTLIFCDRLQMLGDKIFALVHRLKGIFSKIFGPPGPHLVAPYCATARLSQRYPPIARYGGFWCLNMANWVRYPPPFLSVSPMEGMRSGGAIPTPSKGESQRYLRDTL